MKKVKVMEDVVSNDVDFGGLELKIAKPSLASDKTLVVAGNFAELGGKIQAVVDRYKDTVLTEENVPYVKTLKGQFVSLRTGIERERKEWKKVYIDPASKLIDSMCRELVAIVDKGESALGAQLEEYDRRRKDELTVVLKEYVADAAERHSLREEYAVRIKLLDKYYNKTQHEEDSADDIERQACELEKEQKDHDGAVELIKEECADGGFLPDTYIRELEYKSVTEIIKEIKADRKAREEARSKEENGEKVVVGEPLPSELEKEMASAASRAEKERNVRERVLRVRYTADQAKLMARFFKDNSIEFEFLDNGFWHVSDGIQPSRHRFYKEVLQ